MSSYVALNICSIIEVRLIGEHGEVFLGNLREALVVAMHCMATRSIYVCIAIQGTYYLYYIVFRQRVA